MKKLIFSFLVLSATMPAFAGEIEYFLNITGVKDGYLVVEDHRRQQTFRGYVHCSHDGKEDSVRVYTGTSSDWWAYSIQNLLKETGISCVTLFQNIKGNADIDDLHVTYDAATLAIKRMTALPKEKK